MSRTALVGALAASAPASAQRGNTVVLVHGVAYDALRGQPLRDAHITLVGGARNTITDSRGRFQFDSVTPGVHTFAMQHAALDSMGFSGFSTRADVTTGRDEVRISVPTFALLWRAACGRSAAPRDSGFIYGTIRDATGLGPVANATVEVTWNDIVVDKRRAVRQRQWRSQTRSDSTGSYAVCGVPPNQWLRVRAVVDSDSSGAIDAPPTAFRVQRRDLVVGPGERDSTRRGTIAGLVSDAGGRPFADARVLVEGRPEVRTAADGRFAIPNVQPGTRQVEVLSVGVAPVVTVVDVPIRDTANVAIQFAKPIELTPVRVVGARTGRVLAAEFDLRRKSGLAYTFDSTTIATFPRFPNLFQTIPSLHTQYQRTNLVMTMPGPRGGTCVPEVRIDGVGAGFGHLIDLEPKEVAAVEVYARALSVPTQFVQGAGPPECGMILVWTKYGFRLR